MRRVIFSALTLSAALIAAPPVTAEPVDVAVASTAGYQYALPVVTIPRGASLRLVQLDPLDRHDVISRAMRRGRPLFGKPKTLAFGETTLVAGVEELKPATYPFTCSIHSQMSGRIVVRD